MNRILDFNGFTSGTIIDNDYDGVTISAIGGSGDAMIFDTANPTGGDRDLATTYLGGFFDRVRRWRYIRRRRQRGWRHFGVRLRERRQDQVFDFS